MVDGRRRCGAIWVPAASRSDRDRWIGVHRESAHVQECIEVVESVVDACVSVPFLRQKPPERGDQWTMAG